MNRTSTSVGAEAYHGRAEPARASMVILPCPTCGRAVQVFGRMRRVLCACGETLMEIQGAAGASERRRR